MNYPLHRLSTGNRVHAGERATWPCHILSRRDLKSERLFFIEHRSDPPHHSSPCLAILPHPRHQNDLPALSAFLSPFPCLRWHSMLRTVGTLPSPAIGTDGATSFSCVHRPVRDTLISCTCLILLHIYDLMDI